MEQTLSVDLRGIGIELKMVSKVWATQLRKQIRVAVTEAGAELLAAAKANSSWSTGHTSTKKHPHTAIPDAITLRTTFGARAAGVTLRTDSKKAPHARPLEFGSQGNGNMLRHPGHGNREGAWGEQPTRPFFFKSVKEAGPGIDRRIMAAVDQACREAGFR